MDDGAHFKRLPILKAHKPDQLSVTVIEELVHFMAVSGPCAFQIYGQVQPFALIAQRRELFNRSSVNVCQPLHSDDAMPGLSIHLTSSQLPSSVRCDGTDSGSPVRVGSRCGGLPISVSQS
jgi:hypothetical protein